MTLLSPLLAIVLSYVVFAAYRARTVITRLRAHGKPMPPFSWVFGHLLVIKNLIDKLPKDAVFNYVALNLSRTFTKHHMFYLDFWPFTIPILVVADPDAATQIMQRSDVHKPSNVTNAFAQMTGGPNLITMPEQSWKTWRSIFAPGFSQVHMLQQVPLMIDQGRLFCGKLREAAQKGALFQLEEATFRLTIDVISILGLDVKLNYQLQNNKFPDTMRSLIEIVTFGQDTNPLQRWNPLRPFLVWYYGRILDSYIHAELDKRFSERKALIQNANGTTEKTSSGKSSASLALDADIKEHKKQESATLDPDFRNHATAQMRLFLVAGHDTTSSAMTYSLHLLYKHPAFLSRVRAEHDSVFGPDIMAGPDILSSDPNLLNQLPLTTAAIKETLRLFPPAGGIRMGSPDITLVASDGTTFPTADCAVWIVHEAVHRNPAYWPRADEFVPERWLVGPEDAMYPHKGAWRAFEWGPHNCIGQTLALTEIKTLLVMVLRQFDVKDAYAECDAVSKGRGIKTANGERAYQVCGGGGGQHPAERYPCRVALLA